MKIRTKFVLFLMIFVLVFFVLMYFISLRISRNRIMESINNHINTTVKFKAQNIETLIENYKDITELLAVGVPATQYFNNSIEYKTREKNFKTRITNTIKINDSITRIRILDDEGIVVVSSHEDKGMNISDSKIFMDAKKGICIGELHFSKFTDEYVLSIAAPIYTKKKISGILIINFAAEKQLFPIIVDKTGLVYSTDIYLLNKDNYLISTTRYGDKLLETKIEPEQISLCYDDHLKNIIPEMELKKQISYINYHGKKVLRTHYYISSMQWFLIIEVNAKDTMRPIMKYKNLLAILFSIILILSLGILYILSIFLTKPIKKLKAGVQEIINGDLDYKVATKSKDEIGQLSRVFDEMTTRLIDSQRELKSHAGKLEEQVKERTAELEKKIEESMQQRQAILNIADDLEKINIDMYKEIETRVKAEEQIKRDLKEKSILLQELYHRTKNNMQVISSMLRMQSRSLKNKSPSGNVNIDFLHDSFNDVINKIRSMSLVHQKLYQAKDLSNINLKEYIQDLIKLLMISYRIKSEKISLKLELEDVFVLIDSAMPLSLILNELVSNVFKHSFPDNTKGELSIRLFKDKNDTINIQLSDNGVGIPNDIDLENINTMGLQTVFDLVKYQLKGKVNYETKNGLKWYIGFKDNLHKKRV